jgi:hypothetical protein
MTGVVIPHSLLLDASASLLPVRFNIELGRHPLSASDPAARVELDLSVTRTCSIRNSVTVRVRRIMSGGSSLREKMPERCLRLFDFSFRSRSVTSMGIIANETIDDEFDDEALKRGVGLDVTVLLSRDMLY